MDFDEHGDESRAEMDLAVNMGPLHRILLADDHEDVLGEIRELLAPNFDIVAGVVDGPALVSEARKWLPDVVISDVQMPGMNGIEACRAILRDGSCKAAVILTMHNESHLVKAALQAGILGYVLKIDAGDELVSSIRSALGGSVYLSEGVRTRRFAL